jgi:hypothetical protein
MNPTQRWNIEIPLRAKLVSQARFRPAEPLEQTSGILQQLMKERKRRCLGFLLAFATIGSQHFSHSCDCAHERAPIYLLGILNLMRHRRWCGSARRMCRIVDDPRSRICNGVHVHDSFQAMMSTTVQPITDS